MSETAALAEFVTASRIDDVPADVVAEARRAILNYLGCALGGASDPAVDTAIATFAPFSGNPTAVVLGRPERFDPLHAALLNGISSHVNEYDDTLPHNLIHASVPVGSALFAYAGSTPVSGRDFVHAFILGFEVESRIGNAMYAAHYGAGWHITSTAGTFGAAAAIGRLVGLTPRQMVWAFGLAATQAAGIREMFGSMAKSFQPGRAAQNGYTAALLAHADFTAGELALEGPRGYLPVAAGSFDLTRITDGLGKEFDLRRNAYKPYACGLVVHPTIDGCSRIRAQHAPDPAAISAVRLRVAPLVMDLCNQTDLQRALQSKYSIYHAAAIGLVRGKGGLQEFTEAAVHDPVLARIRGITSAEPDAAVTEDQVHIDVVMQDGRHFELFVEESLGNLNRPLTDADLEAKFRDQAVLVLPESRVAEVIDICWRIDSLELAGNLCRATVPDAVTERAVAEV